MANLHMPPQTNKKSGKKRIGTVSAVLILILWFGILGTGFANRQNILDWYKLRGYQAPAAIAQLASDDSMSVYARKVFYVNRPELDEKQQFAQKCPNDSEQTIVLGCYHSNQRGIDMRSVNDARLNGVEEVTAAHEMLHAIYDRLGPNEKQKVDKMLQDYYDRQLSDQRIKNVIDSYKKTEPNDLVNEMHSIFGTEISSLPPELENYYRQYFNDRQKVVSFAEQYKTAFTSLQNRAAAIKSQLNDMRSQIDSLESSLKVESNRLDNDRNHVSTAQQADAFNARIDAYNNGVNRLKALIDQYNSLIDEYNNIATQEQQLSNELRTDVSPAQQQ